MLIHIGCHNFYTISGILTNKVNAHEIKETFQSTLQILRSK